MVRMNVINANFLADELESLLEFRNRMDTEMDNFNTNMDAILGGDSRSMYLTPCTMLDDYIVDWIVRRLDDSREGAEWFLYEAVPEISKGYSDHSSIVEADGKKFHIRNTVDYVNMCLERKSNGDEK